MTAGVRIPATDVKPGDVLSRGDVVESCVPVSLDMIKGWARMGSIDRAALVKFVGNPKHFMVIDRIHFNVVRSTKNEAVT